MKSKLYKIAFISSPLLALIAAAPAYVLEGKKITFFVIIWSIMTFFIFAFWNINIFLIFKINPKKKYKRYFISYSIVLLIQCLNVCSLTFLELKPKDYNLVLPFLGAIALNTLIIILSNSIILQFQKENAELEVEQLKVQNLEAQKQMLLQQLQPHFLFNALSTLKSLIHDNPNYAENYVVKLSDFLRYSVQAKNNETVSLEDELKFSQDYFDLQKARFDVALHLKISIPSSYTEKKVPVYAIQTLIENAIKHNSFTERKPLHISISMLDNRILVENNKVSKILVLPSGTGLKNLNLRYKMIAEKEIEIVETDESFKVLIHLL